MFKKVVLKSLGLVFAVGFAMLVYNTDFSNVFTQPNGSYITYEDVSQINEDAPFGKFVSAALNEKEVKVGNEIVKQSSLKFKLFGFLTLKEVSVHLADAKLVYVGGIPLGFALETKGVIVIGENSVLTAEGDIIPHKSEKFVAGDILTKIDDKSIIGAQSIVEALADCKGEELTITAKRKNKEFKVNLKPALDLESGKYKLGLWVRDDASGVGTLTYVDKDTLGYGALGHPITDYETGAVVPVQAGKIYNCTLVGINKGEKGKPGELLLVYARQKPQRKC